MLQYNKAFSKSVNQISVFWETPLKYLFADWNDMLVKVVKMANIREKINCFLKMYIIHSSAPKLEYLLNK